MSKYIDADLLVEMQIYDDEHEELGVWNGTIKELLDQWTEQGCPPTIEVSEDAISRANTIKLLKDNMDYINADPYPHDCACDLVETAPSVIPQVPNEDAISREWVLNTINAYMTGSQQVEHMKRIIEDAPSVVPQPKEGEWIEILNDRHRMLKVLKCSNCEEKIISSLRIKETSVLTAEQG